MFCQSKCAQRSSPASVDDIDERRSGCRFDGGKEPAMVSAPEMVLCFESAIAWFRCCRWCRLVRARVRRVLVILEKERAERYRLVSAMEARDINSRFADVDGVSVHHKYFTSSSSKEKAEEDEDDDESSGVLFSMAHGFGANTYSYEMAFVDKLLEMENANDNNNSVGIVCHDSVGFGLTERPRTDLIKYTKVFNAKCLKAMARKYAGKGRKRRKLCTSVTR